MLLIIGIILVMVCVIGGFLMIDGPLGVLLQPSEFVVIGGAVIGATLAANPLKFLMRIMKLLPAAMKGSPYNSERDTNAVLTPAATALAQLQLPPGFKATLFAAEPDVQNPIACAWDARSWHASGATDSAARYDVALPPGTQNLRGAFQRHNQSVGS